MLNTIAGEIIIQGTQNNNEAENVLLVQGNFSKKEKWNTAPEDILDKYLKLTDKKFR